MLEQSWHAAKALWLWILRATTESWLMKDSKNFHFIYFWFLKPEDI